MSAGFDKLTSRMVVLPADNIDTDQIIPARFLKVIDKQGLGQNLFADWRQADPDFVLDKPASQGAQVLLAGDNFGCGSSREHAPWALVGWGFRAVISTSFADIFRGNALKNGLLPVQVDAATHARLLAAPAGAEVVIDLESTTLSLPDASAVSFPVDPFARHCLLQGVDELGYILSFKEQIEAYEQRHSRDLRHDPA